MFPVVVACRQLFKDLVADNGSKQAGGSGGSIKFFAADLLKEGSFDEACKGCAVIFHTASPFALSVKDPQKDLVDPAVKGTENVLTSASKTPSVTRVVVTSSVVAMYNHASDLLFLLVLQMMMVV